MAKILLVDDDEYVRFILSRYLKKAGHSAIEFASGRGVNDAIKSESPDLLLTDIVMPDVEGMEVILNARAEHPGLPIIAISGGGNFNQQGYLETALALGANAALEKPINETKLLELIDQLLG